MSTIDTEVISVINIGSVSNGRSIELHITSGSADISAQIIIRAYLGIITQLIVVGLNSGLAINITIVHIHISMLILEPYIVRSWTTFVNCRSKATQLTGTTGNIGSHNIGYNSSSTSRSYTRSSSGLTCLLYSGSQLCSLSLQTSSGKTIHLALQLSLLSLQILL